MPSESTILCKFLEDNQDVFAQNDSDVGRIKIARHTINCTNHPPIQLRPYRRSSTDYDEIRRQVKDLIDKKLIRESSSPWAFPVALVPKKDGGSPRMVIDYRKLNAITIDDKMPVPIISEVFDRLKGACYFTKLDIAWGFWHIEMDPKSIDKTAFVTNEGHYEWLVMPFGLKNAPATFQRIIQNTLGPLLYKGVINYLDDFIIYSETFDQHMVLLEECFKRLRANNIKLKLSKFQLAKQEVDYLGHLIRP